MTSTSISTGSLRSDHIDLLVTAAARYGVLSNPTTAAFSAAALGPAW